MQKRFEKKPQNIVPFGSICVFLWFHHMGFVFLVVLGQTQFLGSEFGIFGGFGWVHSSVLVGEPGFERVREVQPLGFEAVRSSLFLGSTQH